VRRIFTVYKQEEEVNMNKNPDLMELTLKVITKVLKVLKKELLGTEKKEKKNELGNNHSN